MPPALTPRSKSPSRDSADGVCGISPREPTNHRMSHNTSLYESQSRQRDDHHRDDMGSEDVPTPSKARFRARSRTGAFAAIPSSTMTASSTGVAHERPHRHRWLVRRRRHRRVRHGMLAYDTETRSRRRRPSGPLQPGSPRGPRRADRARARHLISRLATREVDC